MANNNVNMRKLNRSFTGSFIGVWAYRTGKILCEDFSQYY